MSEEGKISAMSPILVLDGEEYIEVIRRDGDGFYRNYKLPATALKGKDGLTAYQVAVTKGYQGTISQWLASLNGSNGKSAFAQAVEEGFVGTFEEWIAAFKGDKGDKGDEGDKGDVGEDGLSVTGADGASAYQVAVVNGFVGTETDWLLSLKGETGNTGLTAYNTAVINGFVGTEVDWLASLKGTNGTNGSDGAAGASAYQVAIADGFVGSEASWLLSLKGAEGNKGDNGLTAYQVAVINGFVGDISDWLASLKGAKGNVGDSAYLTALINGYVGTENDWIASLQGTPGVSAYDLAVGLGFVGSPAAWIASLKGAIGTTGNDGLTAYQVAVAGGYVGTEAAWLLSLKGDIGSGVPEGGTTGQVLAKVDNSNFNTMWVTPSAGGAGSPTDEWLGVTPANFNSKVNNGELGNPYNTVIGGVGLGSYANFDPTMALGLFKRVNQICTPGTDGRISFTDDYGFNHGVTGSIVSPGPTINGFTVAMEAASGGSYGMGQRFGSLNRIVPNSFSASSYFIATGEMRCGDLDDGYGIWRINLNDSDSLTIDITYDTAISPNYHVRYSDQTGSDVILNTGIPAQLNATDNFMIQIAPWNGWELDIQINAQQALLIPLTSSRFWVELVDPAAPPSTRKWSKIKMAYFFANRGPVPKNVVIYPSIAKLILG